jgi:hypothetical protein
VPSYEVLALADVVTITKTKRRLFVFTSFTLNFILGGVVELLSRRRPQPSLDEALPELRLRCTFIMATTPPLVAIAQPVIIS